MLVTTIPYPQNHITSQKLKEVVTKMSVNIHSFCPIIVVKAQRAPNAQSTLQIVDRHYEELKSSRPDSQTLKKAF
jgi:hypothetical protein